MENQHSDFGEYVARFSTRRGEDPL